MKPILLKIKGINSFQDEQTVDFQTLTAPGFFGIFGNTGSGKSTILDAITLALYGSTSRKSNNFINLNKKEAEVYFKFAITKNMTKYYGVQQSFKRKQDGSVSKNKCKLVEYHHNGETTVISSTVRELDASIQELIGLKLEDFFRTVVIPQGKFSDFMSLKGAERCNMLERLFHLEEFGSKLDVKLKNEFEKQKKELDRIDLHLEHLSDCTQELFQENSQFIATSEESEKKLQIQQKEIQEVYAEYEEIYSYQKEKESVASKLETLKEKENEISEFSTKLQWNSSAEIVKPHCDNFLDIDKKHRESLEKLVLLQDAKELLAENRQILEKKHMNAVEEKEKNYSKLQENLADLKHCMEDEVSIQVQNTEIELLQEEIDDIQVNVDEIETKLNNNYIKLKETENEIQKTKSSLQEIQQTSAQRKVIQDAIQSAEKLSEKRDSAHEYSKKIDNLQEKLVTSQKNERKKQDELSSTERDIGTIKEDTQEKKLVDDLKQEEELLSLLLEKETASSYYNWVKNLQEHCKIQDSCPICQGRIQEFADLPAKSSDDFSEEISSKQQIIETLKEKLDVSRQEATQETHRLQINQTKLQGEMQHLQENIRTIQEELQIITEESNKNTQEAKVLEEMLQKQFPDITDFSLLKQEQEERDLKREELENSLIPLEELEKNSRIQIDSEKSNLVSEENNLNLSKGKQTEKILVKETLEKKLLEKHGCISGFQEKYDITAKKMDEINHNLEITTKRKESLQEEWDSQLRTIAETEGAISALESSKKNAKETLEQEIISHNIPDIEKITQWLLPKEEKESLTIKVNNYKDSVNDYETQIRLLVEKLAGRSITAEKWDEISENKISIEKEIKNIQNNLLLLKEKQEEMKVNLEKKEEFAQQQLILSKKTEQVAEMRQLLKGKAFVEYIAIGRLRYISKAASLRLQEISNNNYQLEVDDNGEFIIKDNKNGGVSRDCKTLSGGETFLVSFSLALALSSEIQLRSTAPLELFFLDEGFGTLDENLIDIVMDSLEKIHHKHLKIGLISHVESIKERMDVKLLVHPATNSHGSRLEMQS